MMYFADSPQLYELKVKSGNGKVYVGFEGPPVAGRIARCCPIRRIESS